MDHGFYPTNLNDGGLRIGIVQACFNESVCEALRETYAAELKQLSAAGEDAPLVIVPGVLEVPLALQKMAELGQFNALVALGAIIRGEAYHSELVFNESGVGITRVGLGLSIVIANGILTTDTDAQAHACTREEGRDYARTAAEMASLTNDLNDLQDHGQDDDDESE